MRPPLGFFLTFRTYGTWLHGDDRGSIDRNHNAYGAPWLNSRVGLERYERATMRHDACVLNEDMRRVVDGALRDKCAFRDWELRACSVRSNHVHMVVMFADVGPERLTQELKSRATRALREAGLMPADRPVWADHPGSRRYLWRPEDVLAAIRYVDEGQDAPR